ncbi:MAG: MBL fold metallo-hydrolase [Oscillospiraceae bacterium]
MPQEIMKNIFRIQVPLPKNPLKILNSYVIKSDERNLLIDTGFRHPDCEKALLDGLEELDVRMEETDILLTHLHSDHTGLAPEIATPETNIYISRVEIPWLFGDSRRDLWELDNEKIRRSGFSAEIIRTALQNAPSRDMSPDIDFDRYLPIDNGDVFTCGDYRLEAVETPGHTPAHMCFWMEDQKSMFVGDHVLFDITPNITLWNFVEDSLGDYLDSLRAIDKYDVRRAFPGHREPGDFHSRIAYLLEHHDMRLAECYQAVVENPDASAFKIAGKLTWNIRCSSWEEFPIGQKWFAVGECHSHLRHLEMLGKITANYDEETVTFRAV